MRLSSFYVDFAKVAAFFLAAFAAVTGSFLALAVAVLLLTCEARISLGGRR